MPTTKRTITVFYHHPCLDGSAAAWVFHRKWGEDKNVNLRFVPLTHGDPQAQAKKISDNADAGAEMFFLDMSPGESVLNHLLAPDENGKTRVKSVSLIDHHASNATDLKNYKAPASEGFKPPPLKIIMDASAPSASLMVWKELFGPEQPPEFLRWVSKMDSPSDLRDNDEHAVAAFIDSKDIGTPQQAFESFNVMEKMAAEEMMNYGRPIYADQLNKIKKLLANTLFAELELMPGAGKMWLSVVNADIQGFGRSISAALVAEASKGTSVGVAGAWFVKGDGTVTMSIRTSGIPDAGQVAKHLGATIGVSGGGHTTDAAVHFRDTDQFFSSVRFCTRDQMRALQWQVVANDATSPSKKQNAKKRQELSRR